MPSDLQALFDRFAAHPSDTGTLHALRDAAAGGAVLTPLHPLLVRLLESPNRPTAVLASSALAFCAVNRADWSALPPLFAHPSDNVRWGAARALAEILARGRVETPLVDPLALATADPDREVRKQALEGLKDARKLGKLPLPSAAGLEAVLDRIEQTPQVAEYVHDLASRDHATAQTVGQRLKGVETPAAATLGRLCADIAAGLVDPPCPICSNLEGFECAGDEEGLPPQTRQLVPADADLRHCPLCGTRYTYGWEELYSDEWGSTGTWQVRRLSPPAGERSPDALWEGLSHPSPRIQSECAGELAVSLLDARDWQGLGRLLTHDAPLVRSRAMGVLAIRAGGTVALDPLVDVLRTRLTDSEEDARLSAGRLLAWHAQRNGDLAALRALLADPAHLVRWGACCSLREAAEQPDSPLPLLRADLERLSQDREILPRQAAISLLEQIGPDSAAVVPALISLLRNPDREVFDEGVSELGNLAFMAKLDLGGPRLRSALEQATAELGALLPTLARDRWSSLTKLLEECARAGLDLAAARPGIEKAAAAADEPLGQRLRDLVASDPS